MNIKYSTHPFHNLFFIGFKDQVRVQSYTSKEWLTALNGSRTTYGISPTRKFETDLTQTLLGLKK